MPMSRVEMVARLNAAIRDHVEAGLSREDPAFRRAVKASRAIRKRLEGGPRTDGAVRIRRKLEREILVPLRSRRGAMTLLSVDVEYSADGGAFDELGITSSGPLGRTALNLRIAAPRRDDRFEHGSTRQVSQEEAARILLLHAESCDAYVGHALKNDRARLRMAGIHLPDRPVLDTATWSAMMYPNRQSASLNHMCILWGIRHVHRHIAGNDAAATLDLVDAILKDGLGPGSGPDGSFEHPIDQFAARRL
jgi:hypothetical protein